MTAPAPSDSQIFVHVDDIPGESHEMFGPRAALGENGRDVAQGLADLCERSRPGKWPRVSQPITPPVTTRRPSAATPLAHPLGAGQPPGCRICGPAAGASSPLPPAAPRPLGRLWRAHRPISLTLADFIPRPALPMARPPCSAPSAAGQTAAACRFRSSAVVRRTRWHADICRARSRA